MISVISVERVRTYKQKLQISLFHLYKELSSGRKKIYSQNLRIYDLEWNFNVIKANPCSVQEFTKLSVTGDHLSLVWKPPVLKSP